MGTDEDSLFSLELVIEKLYLPHTICRFPAVAFRLLDFPTILIKHVEDDLGKTIKKKISMDPYYQLPNQFDELKDKHGNFMIKKGKSCLFKISVNTFRKHLSSTPLYMMIMDDFPNVRKLVGNSSIPLDVVMEAIHGDISKMGCTVPSVHGDKGLFKVYNLMGKEIGYVILGYRLLSLGPGLLQHIPNAAISNRMSEVKEIVESKVEKKVHVHVSRQPEIDHDVLNNTQDMGSMTDIEKCDVFLQTVETCDKSIGIDLWTEDAIEVKKAKSSSQTNSTQTEKTLKKKNKPPSEKIVSTRKKELDDDDDGAIIIANVIRPPPLFYNREIEPPETQQPLRSVVAYSYDDDDTTSLEDDITVENISDDDMLLNNEQRPPQQIYEARKKVEIACDFGEPQATHPHITGSIMPHPQPTDPLYPLLSALLDELMSLKGKQQVSGSSVPITKTAQRSALQPGDLAQTKVLSKPNKSEIEIVRGNSQVVPVEPKPANKQMKLTSCAKKSHRKCADPFPGVPKDKGWIRKVPEYGVKKTKLVFGLTNTQRLRLAKGNPDWLKSTEKEVKEAKAQKQKSKEKKNLDPDLDPGNLSDTLTEVRRLASQELNETQKTLDSQYSQYQNTSANGESRQTRKKVRESKDKSLKNEISISNQSKSPRLQRKKDKIFRVKKKHAQASAISDLAKVSEDRQEVQSPMSIEVRIPKTDAHSDEDSENNLLSDSEDDGALKKSLKSPRSSKFPGFVDNNSSLPDSIDGRGNMSLDISVSSSEETPPLESTRASRDHRANIDESRMFQSTDDYDTKQFQSTDEPELQRLISKENISEKSEAENERSETSPVLVTNSLTSARKFQVINPVVSQQSPIPALRRSQLKLDSLNAGPSATITPRSYSSQSSSKRPTPRPRIKIDDRKLDNNKRDLHTESISSYFPSEMENLNTSIASDANYSDDFQAGTDEESISVEFISSDFPKLIPSAKLGYTIS